MLTVKDIEEQRERIQDDLICLLDGLDQEIVDNVCQVVVDRLNDLKAKIEQT